MIIGTATYTVEVQGLKLSNIEVRPSQPDIDKIMLERKADKPLSIEFSLINIFDSDKAKKIIRPVLESILNYLALKFDARIGEPTLGQLSLPQDESSRSTYVESNFDTLRRVTRRDVTLDPQQRSHLSSTLSQLPETNSLGSGYRFAVNQDDPISRFMLLYNVLLQACGDNQKGVEACIKREDPNVPITNTFPRKNKPRGPETVYTRLRNEIGHKRCKSSPNQTRSEIINNAVAFQKLVKSVISTQP